MNVVHAIVVIVVVLINIAATIAVTVGGIVGGPTIVGTDAFGAAICSIHDAVAISVVRRPFDDHRGGGPIAE